MRKIAFAALGAVLCLSAPAKADIVVTISKTQQRMAVVVDGAELYRWPVSTGRRGFATPTGTFHPMRLERHWYSRQYEMTPMPWAMFFFRGYAVHGTMEAYNLGRAASHGCVRLRPDNASTLFSLVHKRPLGSTKIVVMDRPLPASPGAAPMADACQPKQADAPAASTEQSAKAAPADSAKPPVLARAAMPERDDVELSLAAHAHAQVIVPREIVARGDEAQVARSRQAWLNGLAHKYGFKSW